MVSRCNYSNIFCDCLGKQRQVLALQSTYFFIINKSYRHVRDYQSMRVLILNFFALMDFDCHRFLNFDQFGQLFGLFWKFVFLCSYPLPKLAQNAIGEGNKFLSVVYPNMRAHNIFDIFLPILDVMQEPSTQSTLGKKTNRMRKVW